MTARGDGLTARQQQLLAFIRAHLAERGYPPTLREMGEHMGISSTNAVTYHLVALEKRGAIKRDRKVVRGLRVMGSAS